MIYKFSSYDGRNDIIVETDVNVKEYRILINSDYACGISIKYNDKYSFIKALPIVNGKAVTKDYYIVTGVPLV